MKDLQLQLSMHCDVVGLKLANHITLSIVSMKVFAFNPIIFSILNRHYLLLKHFMFLFLF